MEGVIDTLGVIDMLGVGLGLGGTYALTCIMSSPPPVPFLVRVNPP
jgi:hypothetical protein